MFLTSRPIYACEGGSLQRSHIPHVFRQKRSDEIKARAWANDCTQQSHIAKEEANTPVVTSEAIFIQETIFTHKGRDVAKCDKPGAFLQVDNPDYVMMRLDGILAELMVQLPRPSIVNMWPPMQKARQSYMSNWRKLFTKWWRVLLFSIASWSPTLLLLDV